MNRPVPQSGDFPDAAGIGGRPQGSPLRVFPEFPACPPDFARRGGSRSRPPADQNRRGDSRIARRFTMTAHSKQKDQPKITTSLRGPSGPWQSASLRPRWGRAAHCAAGVTDCHALRARNDSGGRGGLVPLCRNAAIIVGVCRGTARRPFPTIFLRGRKTPQTRCGSVEFRQLTCS